MQSKHEINATTESIRSNLSAVAFSRVQQLEQLTLEHAQDYWLKAGAAASILIASPHDKLFHSPPMQPATIMCSEKVGFREQEGC